MEATVENLKKLIREIDSKIFKLQNKIREQSQEILELKNAHQELQQKHKKTLMQIKEYIKKIDHIKSQNNVDIDNNN